MPNNKYIFKGTLRFDSALHIGGGTINETNTDSPIVKTPDGLPYIPGSSIKGAFRSLVERVTAQIPGLSTCQLNDENVDCPSSKESEWSVKYEDENGNEKIKSENRIAQELNGEIEGIPGLCDTCKLFGSPHRAAKVFFRDSVVEEWAEMTQVRDGVVIDRDSGTAVTNLKYDYEILPVDATFNFELVAEDVDDKDLGLLAIGLNEMSTGEFLLGGKTTRGLGNCRLENLEVYISDWEEPVQFKKYLLGQRLEEKYSKLSNEEAEQFLNKKVEYLFAN